MARPKVIPEALAPEVLKLAAAGWSYARIAKWLLQTHSIQITGQSVGALCRQTRADRSEASKAVVSERLAQSLGSDLDVLDARVGKLREMCERLETLAERDPEAIELYLKAAEQLRRMVDLKLHYVGADTPDEVTNGLAEFLGLAFEGEEEGDG